MEEELELYGFGNWLIGVLIILLKFSMSFQLRFFMVRKLFLALDFYVRLARFYWISDETS